MNSEPRGAERRRLIGPDTYQIRRSVSEEAGQLGGADALGGGLALNQRTDES